MKDIYQIVSKMSTQMQDFEYKTSQKIAGLEQTIAGLESRLRFAEGKNYQEPPVVDKAALRGNQGSGEVVNDVVMMLDFELDENLELD